MIDFIAKPVSGLPFVDLHGHSAAELCRVVAIFMARLKADRIAFHPVQTQYLSSITSCALNRGINCFADNEVLPTEGKFYAGDKVVGIIRGLQIPNAALWGQGFSEETVKAMTDLERIQVLQRDAELLEESARSLRYEAKALQSKSAEASKSR